MSCRFRVIQITLHLLITALCFNISHCLAQRNPDGSLKELAPTVFKQWSKASILGASISPDGNSFLTYAPSLVQQWDAESNDLIRTFFEVGVTFHSALFSPDSEWVVGAGDDHHIYIWNARTGALHRKFEGHTDVVTTLDFSSDGQWLASGGADKMANVWEMPTGNLLRSITSHVENVSNVAFKLGPSKLLTSNGPLVLSWNTFSGAPIRGYAQKGIVESLSASSDGIHFVLVNQFGEIFLFDYTITDPIRQYDGRLIGEWVAQWLPDGNRFMVAGQNQNINIWSKDGPEMLHSLKKHESTITHLDVNGNGSRALSLDENLQVIIWDITSNNNSVVIPIPRLNTDGFDLVASNLLPGTKIYLEHDRNPEFLNPIIRGPWDVTSTTYRFNNQIGRDLISIPNQFYRVAIVDGDDVLPAGAQVTAILRDANGEIENIDNSNWVLDDSGFSTLGAIINLRNLQARGYNLEVSVIPENFWNKSELWYSGILSVQPGVQDHLIQRNLPYISRYEIVHPQSGNIVSEIEQNDTVKVRIHVNNPGEVSRWVRASYIAGRDVINNPDFSRMAADASLIRGGESKSFEWDMTLSELGQYSDTAMIESVVQGWRVTDTLPLREDILQVKRLRPAIFSNISPANGFLFSENQPNVWLDWASTQPTTSYDVYLEKGDATPDIRVASGLIESQWKVSIPLGEGTWYWRVVAHNNESSREGQVWGFKLVPVKVDPDDVVLETGTQFTINNLSMTLMPIPSGTFLMGSPSTEIDREINEGPLTTVQITDSYWMGRNEVTIEQFRQYLLAGGSSDGIDFADPDCPINDDATYSLKGNQFGANGQQPMIEVSWQAAIGFCEWLTELAQEEGWLPQGYRFSLPTEAQWEYATRAKPSNEPGSRFFYGIDVGYLHLGDYAWYAGTSDASTHAVGQKLPNPWGLHDIYGNVWEWCLDWYQSEYQGGTVIDPKGPSVGQARITRGNGWRFPGRHSRSAYRFRLEPNSTENDTGFRVALTPQ